MDLKKQFSKFFLLGDIDTYDRKKILWLSATFFLVIAAYTLIKEFKDAMFVAIVGREYLPWAKLFAMVILIPMIFFYSKLVDVLHRYQLLIFYGFLYGLSGLVFTYYLGHPTIGLENTQASYTRIFGWLIYFFYEGYSPFVVSVFWAFASSINNPKTAQNGYAIIVSASKIGGMLTPAIAWYLLEQRDSCGLPLYSDVLSHQILLGLASLIVLLVPIVIYSLINTVPSNYLHGYEAAYRVEKEKKEKGTSKTGIFGGLWMLLQYPYMLGIYSMIFFYEVINVVLNYQRISSAESASSTIAEFTCVLYQQVLAVHAIGFIISFFGTRALMKSLGERRCLLLVPISIGLLIVLILAYNTLPVFTIAFIAIRSIHYAFSYPVRESLYIPTVKTMKFKAKSWIDAFGSKFAKSSGAWVNIMADQIGGPGTAAYFGFYSVFFFIVIGLWIISAYFMGRKFEQVVNNNEVIGDEHDSEVHEQIV
jgi:ATP:ADP antiporter, AAA family